MKQYGIDRFEGDLAVLVDGEGYCIHVPRKELPSNVTEGDIVVQEEGIYRIREAVTAELREEAAGLIDELFC